MYKFTILILLTLIVGCKENASTIKNKPKESKMTETSQDSIPTRKSLIEKWEEYKVDTTLFAINNTSNTQNHSNITDIQNQLYWNIQLEFYSAEPWRYLNEINLFMKDYISYNFDTREKSMSLSSPMVYIDNEDLQLGRDTTTLQFARDTFMINETCRVMLHNISVDESCIMKHCYRYEFYSSEYLVYKYYKLALNNMDKADKKLLIQNQAEWETTIQSEYELVSLIERKYLGRAKYFIHRTSINELRKRAEFLFWVYYNTNFYAD